MIRLTCISVSGWNVRQGKTPSCNIDAAFQEAMTAHMGTRAYLEGRTMYWDKDKEEIVRGELA